MSEDEPSDDGLNREQWVTVLEEVDLATFGELVAALEERDLVSGDPTTIVGDATAPDGPLVETESTGAYPEYRLADEKGEKYRPSTDTTPLEEYEPKGYVRTDDDALDAAVALTASRWGPPFDTPIDEAGEWWEPAYRCACRAVESAVVDALGEFGAEDTDEEDANPGGPTGETTEDAPESRDNRDIPDEDEVREAFADAIRYFHQQLDTTIRDHTDDGRHPDRPTTAREYFAERRGWDEDTLEEALLGWAPPSNGLLDALIAEGYDRETIIATGLFNDRLEPLWQGRYVLPYFDEDEAPTYAIARCTGDKGGGAAGYDGHPQDYLAGKYGKVRHTDERVPLEEPIYGRDTLEDGEPVLIAEGIADAISARERGWSVLSPVTTEFKREHFPPLLDALERYDVPRVTVIADNDEWEPSLEEAGEPPFDSIREAATLPATPPGIAGALRTADYLEGEGVDVRVAVPPAPLGGESDLDEYLQEWADGPEALVRSARPPEAFPEYELATRTTRTDGETFGDGESERGEREPSDGEGSALWDLDLGDLINADAGDRGKNPLGHTGDSENYFVVRKGQEGDLVGRDYKRGVVYNGLTYLLVECSERLISDPEGPLDDREVWHAWRQAKRGGHLPSEDPVPYRALVGLALEDDLVDADELEAWDDGGRKLPSGTYNSVLEHIREEHGLDPGREKADGRDDDARGLLEVDVVVEPRNALAAASAVEPDDLEADLPELGRDDVDDVAIAVALAEGWIPDPDTFPEDGRYTEAYYRARNHYGAPLPKYLDNSTLEEREDLVFAALERITPEHVLDTCRSDVTVEDPPGRALAKLNPTWEDSESGERIVAGYGRGFWCAEHDVSFSPLQLVAIEHDLIDSEDDYPRGEAFKRAYRLLREQYGAPLPRWRATILEHVAVLPPALRLLDDDHSASATLSLEDARDRTEDLLRDAVDVREYAQVLTPPPGTGKTYSTVLAAAERPTLYITQRNDLKEQMADYVAEVRADDEDHPDAEPTAAHLPVLAEATLPEPALDAGVDAVREHGFDLLRDAGELLGHVEPHLDPDAGEEDDDTTDSGFDLGAEEEATDLDRHTCASGEGEHGLEWRVRLQVARALGFTPADLHRHATAIFGETLPCQADGGECDLSAAWDHIRDPATSIDLLIGSPQHAHVDSATTYYEHGPDGERQAKPRAVVVDEFPGDAYWSAYGERYMDHTVWLAEALVGVDNREDLLAAGLDDNTWVSYWLDGQGDELVAVEDALEVLEAARAFTEASERADEILKHDRVDGVTGDTAASLTRLREALTAVAHAAPADADALDDHADTIASASARLQRDADAAYADGRDAAGPLYELAEGLEDVLEGLQHARAFMRAADGSLLDAARERFDELPVGGDLRALLEDAVGAVRGDAPDGLLDAARTALRGGRDGCRELAVFASDGYAHPDAWALLAGAIADTDREDVREPTTETPIFDPQRESGGRFKRREQNGATVLVDKNHHGAVVADPPAFTGAEGGKCPLVGLDATGRRELWRLALGRDAKTRDIFPDTAARRRFLRETVGLTVVQTSDRPLAYHGEPQGKNFQADLELVRAVAEAYTQGADALDDKGPAVISTLKVLRHLEDDLLERGVDAAVNYENMKGSDALGEHQAAVILGSQHYGDALPELWAAVAGESAGRGDTRGAELDYGSDVANAYLRYMREDHTMQAILRAGRNDDRTVVVAHTSALRDDLPVEHEGALVSAHSRGALAVAEAAADFDDRVFTARDVAEEIGADTIGLRQVQNVLASFRESGYLRVEEEGTHGRAYEYEHAEDAGLADVTLPDLKDEGAASENETSRMETQYTWDFVLARLEGGEQSAVTPGRPTIPARDTAAELADGVEPPG